MKGPTYKLVQVTQILLYWGCLFVLFENSFIE
jgi:hypothetical protein